MEREGLLEVWDLLLPCDWGVCGVALSPSTLPCNIPPYVTRKLG